MQKTCSRGHVFNKTSDCPTCPICWSGSYRKEFESDFPEKLGAPALRALAHAKVKGLAQLGRHTEKEIADLHGMGPKGIKMLKEALKKQRLSFKSEK
jgi:hypothetical protein